jgi:hypothetical protein
MKDRRAGPGHAPVDTPARSAGSRRPGSQDWPALLHDRRALTLIAFGLLLGVFVVLVAQALVATEPLPLPAITDNNPDITVTLTPGLLTALVRQSIAAGNSPVPLKNVRVETSAGELTVLGDVDVLGHSVGSRIVMTPYVQDGQLRMKMREARLGPLPVPGNLERIAEGPINARVAAATSGLPATITGVQATDRGLTVTAHVEVDKLG